MLPSSLPRRRGAWIVAMSWAVAAWLAAPAARATPCMTTANCPPPSVCDTARHLCVGCIDDSSCRGPSPVCDRQAGFCSSCNGDYGSSATLRCAATHPACVTSGPRTGECVECSATNKSACTSVVRPTCDVARSLCGCAADADCGTTTYCDHDVAPQGWCVFGCHVIGGVDRCPTGSHCDTRNGTVGNCQPGECSVDTDCAPGSGKICSAGQCVPRPPNMPDASADAAPPIADASAPADAKPSSDAEAGVVHDLIAPSGCGCVLAGARGEGRGASLGALVGLAVLAGTRRRRGR